jgi:hypothetical protein
MAAVHSPHTVDFDLVDKGLHAEPDSLRLALQEKIDRVREERYDALVLGYALCSNSTAGLVARGLPLVLPRAHDCITLFLGSRRAYAEEFDEHPGTYYYAADYAERHRDGDGGVLGAVSEAEIQRSYEEYVEKYGKENADYLLQVMGGWRKNYRRAAYIEMGVGNEEIAQAMARQEAEKNGWEFARLKGDMGLLHRLIYGEWNADFLIIKPGETVRVTYDESIVQAFAPAKA